MSPAQRQPGFGLIGQLLAEPHRFDFFQAVRLVRLAMRQGESTTGPLAANGQIPIRLRFSNRVALSFPPSDIGGVTQDRPLPGGPKYGLRIIPAFLRLLGSTGALTLHFSQRITI